MKNTKLITASRTTSFRTDKGDIEVVDKFCLLRSVMKETKKK